MLIYIIGSLRNPEIPVIANNLRAKGYEVFDDWFAAGPHADDAWRDYERGRGHTLPEALKGYAARHVFEFDYFHLNRADIGLLVLPAGRSGHMELAYLRGRGKPTYILLDQDPERYDVMYCFATGVYATFEELLEGLNNV